MRSHRKKLLLFIALCVFACFLLITVYNPRSVRKHVEDVSLPLSIRNDFKAFITSSYFYPKSKSLGDNSFALVMFINQKSKQPNVDSFLQPQINIDADNGTNSMSITRSYIRVTPHLVCHMITVFTTVILLPNTKTIYLRGNNGSLAIPFEIPPDVQHDVVVCISPLYVSEQWQNFLFAMHIYKKFGAFVNLYLISAVESFYLLMKEYEKKKYLTIQPWVSAKFYDVSPKIADPYNDSEYRNQAGSQTDCLLKYKETAKFITFLDLDDVLIPRLAPTYLKEFQMISKNNNGRSYLHYNKENHEVTTVNDAAKFSILKMFRTLEKQPVNETGKMVLDPRFLNYTWIHWPITTPEGLTKIIVNDNSITHLKKIRWLDDYPETYEQNVTAFPFLDNKTIKEIENKWLDMKNASKIITHLPQDKFYFNIIRECLYGEQVLHLLNLVGIEKERACPGPHLCDYPQRDEIDCIHVDATYANVTSSEPITFYYATNPRFSKNIGCFPY